MKQPQNVQDKIIDIGEMVLRTSSLTPQAKALIACSTAVSSCCTHCHGEFRKLARKLGIQEDEIEEAEEIAMRMRQRCQNETGLYKMVKQPPPGASVKPS